ncbi:MAG: glycerol kinase GlpK [Planctomycetes bacterium]|nr:glycerol kinase GlpK [Planctomycetota bacterium]
MTDLLAAIDQGTTSTRCMVFDQRGKVVAIEQAEHRQYFPQPGWVEHDAKEIWETTRRVTGAAIDKAGGAGKIAAIGITNQRETTVIWDPRTGEPRGRAIVWQDTRTRELCDQLAKGEGPQRYAPITGLPLATYFSGPKIRWRLDRDPDLKRDAEAGQLCAGTIDSWLIWNLTGGAAGGNFATDITNASRTSLMNLRTLEWDDALLGAIGVPRGILPTIHPSAHADAFGVTKLFGDPIPITGVLGDQHAALLGQGCTQPGDAKNTYGTGCFLLINTGESPIFSSRGLLTTPAWQIRDEKPVYALEGSIAVTGSLIQWLRDNLGLIASAADVESLARQVEDTGDVYIVPAFSGLFAPRWRADARGVIVGLTRATTKAHLARAALEATAYQTREVIDAMTADGHIELRHLKVDGGMTANTLLMQFQADVLRTPVTRPQVTETTCLGAAYAAGLGAGVFADLAELREHWRADQTWEPQMNETESERRYQRYLQAVERSYEWA